MPDAHALLGPSSAHRWMVCRPSAVWESKLPDSTSEHAAEGTLAHAIAEIKLKAELARMKGKRAVRKGIEKLRADPLYTESMDRYTDEYVELVISDYQAYELSGENPSLYVETRLSMDHWVPDSFGTSDAIIICDDRIHVYDFKYGKGVPVSAVNNPQMKMYALGAYDEFSMVTEPKLIFMTIVQPRLGNVSEWDTTVDELLKWADEELAPAAADAYLGKGKFVPGEAQCRFCRGRYICRYNAAYQLRFLDQHFSEKIDPEMSALEIGGILEQCSAIESWAKGVKEMAKSRAMRGEHIPGWKVVKGRTERVIQKPYEAIEKLLANGFKPEQIYELKGITELESVATKAGLANMLGDLIQNKTTKPTLAKETDKREEYNPVNIDPNDYFKSEE